MTSYRPSAIFPLRGRIGRLQFLVGFGYLWLFSVLAAALMIWAQSLSPFAKYTMTAVSVACSILVWGLIALWLKARLKDAGMSPFWISLLVLLFASELRAAFIHPASSGDPIAGWDLFRTASVAGVLGLLAVLVMVRSRKPPTIVLEPAGEEQ
ncbi:uncharacterized membrane protein YhaH (DUF805 family) [Bradyrhizobium sp. USDA 4341]